MKPDSDTTPSISRRKLLGLSIGGALAGGAWSTGFAVLARGVRPQFFVIGVSGWQLVLVEHGQRRALLGLGQFDGGIVHHVSTLMTSLRQHIDIVIGESAFLAGVSSHTGAWEGAVRIQLDGSAVVASSNQFVHLSDRVVLGIGDFTMTLEGLPSGEWGRDSQASRNWISHLRFGQLVVALAPSLDVAAEHAAPESALAVAPAGDFVRLQRVIPNAGIVTNTSTVPDVVSTSADGGSTMVVRTFPGDVASFRIRSGRIELPGWSQRVSR